MNAERVPFEALTERSRVCFGGFRPLKHVEGPRTLARGAPLSLGRQSLAEKGSAPKFYKRTILAGLGFFCRNFNFFRPSEGLP